jgi:hypothetical protein
MRYFLIKNNTLCLENIKNKITTNISFEDRIFVLQKVNNLKTMLEYA